MPEATLRRHRAPSCYFILALLLAISVGVLAQGGQPAGRGGGGQRGVAPAATGAQTSKAAAPVDLTGYWVSIVTEDWIERMSPDSPPSGTGGRGGLGGGRGQGSGGAQAAANPEPCRAYGAAGSLRVPGRLNITWADDNTLKIEMDAGTQTRLLHFNSTTPPPNEKTLQGYSVATWELGGGGRGVARGGGGPAVARWGSLKVVTTNMRGGYLLSSRSSYSDNVVLTEHFTRHSDFGAEYFTVTAIIEDGPTTRVTSSTFKKESNGSKFNPTGCEIVR